MAFHAYGVACRHFAGGPDPATPLTYPEVYAAGDPPSLIPAPKMVPGTTTELEQYSPSHKPYPNVPTHVGVPTPGIVGARFMLIRTLPAMYFTAVGLARALERSCPLSVASALLGFVQGATSAPVD